MRLTRLIATVSVTAAACVGLSAAYAAPSLHAAPMAPQNYTTQADAHEDVILKRVNQLRASLGLSPVTRVQELDDIAQNWSEHMAYAGTISHRPEFQNYYPNGWRGASENVASRQYESEPDIGDKLYEQWQNSPGHYANMVDPDTNTIGIGLTYDASDDKWYGTQNFAAYPDLSNLTVTSSPSYPDHTQPAPTPGTQAGTPESTTPAPQDPPVTVEITPDVTVEEAQAVPAPQAVSATKDEPKTESMTTVRGASAPIKEVVEPETPAKAAAPAAQAPSKTGLSETGLETWIPGSAIMSFLMGGLFLVLKRKYALR